MVSNVTVCGQSICYAMMNLMTLLLHCVATIYCSTDARYLHQFTQNQASPVRDTSLVDSSIPIGRYSILNDHYRCAEVCKCHRKTDSPCIYADCTKCTTHYTPNFPPTLPSGVSTVDISENNIWHFQTDHFASYKFLTKLTARSCRITTVNRSPCMLSSDIRHLDLSNNDIEVLGNNSLSCMTSLKVLSLHNNNIKSIASHVFSGLSTLKTLILSKNKLKNIEAGSFQHCPFLFKLDLSFNPGVFITTEFATVFRPLISLEVLLIQGVGTYGYYPKTALLELTSLRELSLNGEKHDKFDPDFKKLKKLKKLAITGRCWMHNLTSSYFEGLPRLEYLKIGRCPLISVSPDVFDKNNIIRHIEMINSFYSLKDALNFTCTLRKQEVKSLTLAGLRKRSKFKPYITLNGSDFGCLNEMNHLKKLNLDNDYISFMSMDFIRGLPQSLQELSVKANKMTPDSSVLAYVVDVKGTLPNLKSLYEDYQGRNIITYEKPGTQGMDLNSNYRKTTKVDKYVESLKIDANKIEFTEKVIRKNRTGLEGEIPDPQIFSYSASYSFRFGSELLLHKLSAFHFVNFSNTFLTDWGKLPYRHLPKHTVIADLSENRCDYFEPHFFPDNNSLLELHLQGNYFGPLLSKEGQIEHFKTLTQLQYLDLSKNYLLDLPWDLFRHQKNLKFLRLSSNNLVDLDIHVSHMTSLVYLDLKKNSLMEISERTRNGLDMLAERSDQIAVDLQNNPLMCTCQGLEFIKWLRDTRVRILNKDFLTCNTKNMNKELLGDLTARITSLEQGCVSRKILVISCSFAGGFLILICLVTWVFTNRWRLLYWRNLAISRFYGFNSNVEDGAPSFTFDAFFVYTSTTADFVLDHGLDELETKRGHRLCVEDRDFLPGSFIPCNITSAVRSSRTTVVVVDESFKPEGWSQYAVEMAQVEAVRAKRDVLHLLLMDSLPEERLPNVYLKATKDGRVSEMPPSTCSPDVIKVFWDTLSRAIGHCNPDSSNRRPHYFQLRD